MKTGRDYIKEKYGDKYTDFFEDEARSYNQGVLDALDALADKLDDMLADEQIIDYIKNDFIDREEYENK